MINLAKPEKIIHQPGGHHRLRVLFIPIEFPGWQMARSFPYDIQLGLEEGFQANGAEVVTLPALWGHPSSAPGSWLSRARTLLAGQQFDQIWVTLVHGRYEDDFLDWLRTLAPIRIGFVLESLEYTPAECQAHPPYKYRRGYVEHQIRAMTHVLTWDEYDAERLNAEGLAQALWWPGCVPARVITPPSGDGAKLPARFCGAPYGERAAFLEREDLRQLLVRSPAPEDATPLPQNFDKLQESATRMLLAPAPVTNQNLESYLSALRKLRREVFDHWMAALPKACAQVNLPSLVKAYGVRVVEAMAAGCPMISWDIPNRPRNSNLFRDGEEILLFRRDQPAQLAAHIRRLQQEPDWARQIAVRAQAKIAAFHSIEKRIRQVLDWVATGLQPDYGETAAAPNPFIQDSAATPNLDESARWTKISGLIEKIIAGQPLQKSVRILDVGCGRGWLAHLASKFGECEGVEAAAAVVAQAQRLFPNLRFTSGTADTILNAPDFQPYDFVLASEIIEYVPAEQQSEFVRKLSRLLKPSGHVILTTPRGESLQEWTRLWGNIVQPAENWLVEPALRQLFVRENFNAVGQERVFFDMVRRQYVCEGDASSMDDALAIYQVWAFQFPGSQSTVAVSPAVTPGAVMVEYHRACHDAADRALQLLRDDSVLLTARALALLELGETETARQVLAWLIALQPEHAPARRLLARALHRLGRMPEAESHTNRAAQLESACPMPVVSVIIPGQAGEFSFLHHVHEAKLLDGSPAQLETRTTTINRRSAPCISLHPSTKMRFAVPCPKPGRFTCALAIQPEAWNKPTVPNCEFFIHLDGREVFRAEVNPRRVPTDRRWHEVEVDIPAASGPFHEFVLRTKSVGATPDFLRAVWCEPVFRPQLASTDKSHA